MILLMLNLEIMMRVFHRIFLFAGLLCLAGCQNYYSNKILTQDTSSGKLAMTLVGTGPQLCQQKKIDDHQVVLAPDKTGIDLWVIKSKLPDKAPRGTAVLLHGMNESKAAFPYFGAAKPLNAMGFDVVLIDLRAHGRSGGKYITYGAKEKYDVRAALNQLTKSRTVTAPFYLFGSNLGGAIAIQYAAIDPRVKGVVALAPYKDFSSIANWQMTFIAPVMSAKEVEKVISIAASTGEFDPGDASALRAVKKLTCPLLLVHGILDFSVPIAQTQEIFAAATCPKQMVLVTPGPEQAAMALILEDWIALQIDKVATGQLATTQPATAAAK
jgi:alpha-beta hydrolase superfamily lysophospholipase